MPTLRVHRLRLALATALVLLLGALVAVPAAAVEFRNGTVVVIAQDEVINDDLFVSGTTVMVDGTVNGDLWVAASQAEIRGTVNGSLFFAGQSLLLTGNVTGSLYGVGSTATLGRMASVGRNAYFLGGALTARPGSLVRRDLLAAGSQALLRGEVARNVNFGGSALEIDGTVGGNVEASVGAPGSRGWVPPSTGPDTPSALPAGLRVGPNARIAGRLTYRSPVDQSSSIKSQPGGGVVFVPQERRPVTPGEQAARWALGWFREFVILLALGALALWGLGAPLGLLAERVRVVPLLSLGWGILIVLAGYAAAIVALILILIVGTLLALLTLGGLALAVFGVAGSAWAFGFAIFLLAVAYGSKIVVSYLLGRLVLQDLAGQRHVARIWILIVGVLIFSLLRSIPFLGFAIDLAAAFIGLGAIYLVARERPPACC